MTFKPLNMHTDLVVTGNPAGPVTLTGTDTGGTRHSVALPKSLAERIHAAPGRALHPAAHADRPITPYNMHTDGTVKSSDGDKIVLTGKASHGDQDVELEVTISGPARHALKKAHTGI